MEGVIPLALSGFNGTLHPGIRIYRDRQNAASFGHLPVRVVVTVNHGDFPEADDMKYFRDVSLKAIPARATFPNNNFFGPTPDNAARIVMGSQIPLLQYMHEKLTGTECAAWSFVLVVPASELDAAGHLHPDSIYKSFLEHHPQVSFIGSPSAVGPWLTTLMDRSDDLASRTMLCCEYEAFDRLMNTNILSTRQLVHNYMWSAILCLYPGAQINATPRGLTQRCIAAIKCARKLMLEFHEAKDDLTHAPDIKDCLYDQNNIPPIVRPEEHILPIPTILAITPF